jgi:hypothetical protein
MVLQDEFNEHGYCYKCLSTHSDKNIVYRGHVRNISILAFRYFTDARS